MKAKDKIEKWLDDCGYVKDKSILVYLFASRIYCTSTYRNNYPLDEKILSLTNPDGKVHIPPADLHEDDKPEPRDEVLQGYLKGRQGYAYSMSYVLCEFNDRVKVLESILLDGGKGE